MDAVPLIKMIEKLAKRVRYLEQTRFVGPKVHAATVAPTVNDDITLGYKLLSQWLNVTTDTAYICCDNTAGAAVWKQTTP